MRVEYGPQSSQKEDDVESVKLNSERGQILVQVAIMVTVLFAFVALALDGGNIYAGRRRMQNAADAGALAGAQKICFPEANPSQTITQAALDYAINRNGAQTATVAVVGDYNNTVVVTAEQTLDTFFAGVIGINEAHVRAEAAAACGGSASGAGLWPLAFRQEIYTDSVPCGQEFLVFASKEEEDAIDWTPGHCDCDELANLGHGYEFWDDCHGTCVDPGRGMTTTTFIGGGDRGWLLFANPEEPYTFPEECSPSAETTCGDPKVACWLAEDYPGEIEIDDCVAGQSGVNASEGVVSGVDSRADSGDVLRIVLYDRECGAGDPETLGTCPGTPYHVAGFGCIQVLGWEQSMKLGTCGSNATCASLHAVHAVKICEETAPELYEQCSSSGGSTSGVPPEEWESRSVSLIQWPPSGSP
jgi:hypothetical protein